MYSLDELRLESNNQIKINFNGGDLSSDAGLIPVNEFARKIGFDKLIQSKFKTNDTASFRYHTDTENMMQKIYQTVAAYFQDDDADELTHDPVFNAILGKKELASQPTMSRFIVNCNIFLRKSSKVKMHVCSNIVSV